MFANNRNINLNQLTILALFIFSMLSSASNVKADWAMPVIKDFSALAKKAKADNLPIAIYFNRKRCGACEKLKDMAVLPMVENGIVEPYVHIVEIYVTNTDFDTIDFYGEPLPNPEYQALYNITSFPTVVFVDYEGNEIGQRLENSGAYDYYPFNFKVHLNKALAALKNPKRIKESF